MPTDPADATTPDEINTIYRTLIHPVLLADSPGGEASPAPVVLGGQAGSGKSRASTRLLAEHKGMVAVSGDELRIFHPHYREIVTDQPESAGSILAEATRPWVRAAIQHCLDERRSLLLEGSFGDPDVTLATARRFRDASFDVQIVAIASPRVLSIVTAASRYLRDLKVGSPACFTPLSAHDHGYNGTTRLVDALDATSPVDRLTVVNRTGTVLLDQMRDTADNAALFKDADRAINAGRHPDSWGARSTMELLGELKQITNFVYANFGHEMVNPHIIGFPHQDAAANLAEVQRRGGVRGAVLYPTRDTLAAASGGDRYAGAPYSASLALGHAQLESVFFRPDVLDRYRDDPRYDYTLDIGGEIRAREDTPLDTYLTTFSIGFHADAGNDEIVVGVPLRYLHDLSPAEQAYWKSFEHDQQDWILHPDWVRPHFMGEFPERISPYTAILLEMKLANDICAIGFPALFRNLYDGARVVGLLPLYRPQRRHRVRLRAHSSGRDRRSDRTRSFSGPADRKSRHDGRFDGMPSAFHRPRQRSSCRSRAVHAQPGHHARLTRRRRTFASPPTTTT